MNPGKTSDALCKSYCFIKPLLLTDIEMKIQKKNLKYRNSENITEQKEDLVRGEELLFPFVPREELEACKLTVLCDAPFPTYLAVSQEVQMLSDSYSRKLGRGKGQGRVISSSSLTVL